MFATEYLIFILLIAFCFISFFIKVPIIALIVGIFSIICGIYLVINPEVIINSYYDSGSWHNLTETFIFTPLLQIFMIFLGIITMVIGTLKASE